MLQYPADGRYDETTILFANKCKVQFSDTYRSDYEINCENCLNYNNISTGLIHHIPPDVTKGHLIEVVCSKCGSRQLLKPVLHVHYELIATSDDPDYIPLKDRFNG